MIPHPLTSPVFIPPEDVAQAAEKGLRLRQQFGRGSTAVGIAQGHALKRRTPVDLATIKKIASYFARHAVDKKAKGFGNDSHPSKGYIAWLLWGGDAGRDWVGRIKKHLEEKSPQAPPL